jgi:type II secretory pathway pseudopilin PulG
MIRPKHANTYAFSLIEVVLSIGIIAFCLTAVLGLLPTGLSTQQRAQEEAKAASALNMVSAAVESLRRVSPGTSGHTTWAFPNYFSDNPNPSTTPTIVWVTQNPWTYTFFVDEGGLIIPTGNTTTPRRQVLYVRVYPPQIEGQVVRIYAAVAWPYRPGIDQSGSNGTGPSQMTGRLGFAEQLVAYSPPSSF